MSWSVTIRDSRARLQADEDSVTLVVDGSQFTLYMTADQLVQLLHSLCHVVMDDRAAGNHADEHSSCHGRK